MTNLLDFAELRSTYLRLSHQRKRVNDKLSTLLKQRNEWMQKGSTSGSNRLQAVYARKILELDQQTKHLNGQAHVIQMQQRIVAQLLYARENHDPLTDGALGKVNWVALLREVQLAQVSLSTQVEQLDQVLRVLGDTAPIATSPHPQPAPVATPAAPLPRVTHVPDGDGLALEDGTRVRYIGIDAPEMSGSDGKPEALALEARELNRQLVVGKRVRLVKDTSDTDRYGRLLRYVYIQNEGEGAPSKLAATANPNNEHFVNAEMLLSGLAMSFCVPPNEKLAEEFVRLEGVARRYKRGLWQHGYV
ncbi:MAG: thermonuclease family protein [Anaerolineae bacterium]|nr:thermonuclease family protein [Anaerolineae bacterium]